MTDTMKVWACKVGGPAPTIPHGGDLPMRTAIEKAFLDLTGVEPEFNFSGWGASITESELAVVEDRLPDPRKTFREGLETLINYHSQENGSNTPDFMLAEYLTDCLAAFDRAVTAREKWYGRGPLACDAPTGDAPSETVT